jgi:hypothetical protein
MNKLIFTISLTAMIIGTAYAHSTWVLWKKVDFTAYKPYRESHTAWEIITAYEAKKDCEQHAVGAVNRLVKYINSAEHRKDLEEAGAATITAEKINDFAYAEEAYFPGQPVHAHSFVEFYCLPDTIRPN